MSASDRKPPAKRLDEHVEELIDEALKETFPASDPPAPAVEVVFGKDKARTGKGGKP